MIKAKYSDKEVVVNILAQAYANNDTINETIIQDNKKKDRLRKLIEYSFDTAYNFGEVCFSDDRQSVALIIFPNCKKNTLNTFIWDIKFIFCIAGFSRAIRALLREKAVKNMQANSHIYHIWYLGTKPEYVRKGSGSSLMRDLIKDAAVKRRPLYVESRIDVNTMWYKKFGFTIYGELTHTGRKWACMKIETASVN